MVEDEPKKTKGQASTSETRLLEEVNGHGTDIYYLARLINGVGTGILNAIVPVWATETAEHTSRGQFIAIEFTLNIFGVVVAYWLELFVHPPYSKSLSYRGYRCL